MDSGFSLLYKKLLNIEMDVLLLVTYPLLSNMFSDVKPLLVIDIFTTGEN